MVLDVPAAEADRVAGVRIRAAEPLVHPETFAPPSDAETIMCRCERVTRETVVEFIRTTGARDLNAVKAGLRSGMGPCGGKTCDELILRVFRELGTDVRSVTHATRRPFTQEVPITAFLTVDDGASGV
jgi:NAD(P)H-nitrite reductase large subunit